MSVITDWWLNALSHVFLTNIIAYSQQNRYVRFAIYTDLRVSLGVGGNCPRPYPDNCPPPPPEENCPPLTVGVWSSLGMVLGFGGNKTIVPEKHWPLVRVKVWVRVSFGVGGQFSSGAIVLELYWLIHFNFYELIYFSQKRNVSMSLFTNISV